MNNLQSYKRQCTKQTTQTNALFGDNTNYTTPIQNGTLNKQQKNSRAEKGELAQERPNGTIFRFFLLQTELFGLTHSAKNLQAFLVLKLLHLKK